MAEQPTNGPQLELPLAPHDGSPLSFLAALRRSLNGFNPDRAQIEKARASPVIVAALQRARALDDGSFQSARALFPDFSLPPVVEERACACGREVEALIARVLAWQEPQFPLWMPKVAPGARGARGTPVSAPPLEAAPTLTVSCNRGTAFFPASVTPRAVPVALGFGMRGNSAPAQ